MFWQAARVTGNAIPGAVLPNVNEFRRRSRGTHVKQLYPSGGGARLTQAPTRITARVHLQAVGDDVLTELVADGDLDPSVPAQIAAVSAGRRARCSTGRRPAPRRSSIPRAAPRCRA
jgi:hypothetical protein